MTITFGEDPVRAEVADILDRIATGETVDQAYERKHVDLKEETGRRDRSGKVGPGEERSAAVAQQLAAEAACMANTPGGGALIVGVSNDGTVLGAATDAEWLRHRIYEITGRLLTVDIAESDALGKRLLVIIAPPAVEPVRISGRIHWRVNDNCVEVDAATWHARRMRTLNYDWSGDASTTPASAARAQALDLAREFLHDSGESEAEQIARSSDTQLLRRLNAVTGDGVLTNAGVLVFVGRQNPSLDYFRREYAGGDSATRVNRSGRSLLEELSEVFLATDAHNATRHVQAGLVIRQIREIPELAAREAIVNGVAHREWGSSAPTVVEHIGRTLRVTSPGGFFGGVNSSNIITHPSQSRNAALTQLLADLKVAEREGIGVDRMVREMVRAGHQPPDIREISGPFIRASLVGDSLDQPWIAWLGSIEPKNESMDVYSLLLLRRLVTVGWVDAIQAAPLIQLTLDEARGAISKLSLATIDGRPLLTLAKGTPEGTEAVWRLHPVAAESLAALDRSAGQVRGLPTRPELARSYAQARGRISSTELGSLVGASPSNVGGVLKRLATEDVLAPSSTTGRGRGFYYKWIGPT